MKNFSVQKWTSKDWGVDLNRIAIREKEKDTLQVSEKDLILDQFFTQTQGNVPRPLETTPPRLSTPCCKDC